MHTCALVYVAVLLDDLTSNVCELSKGTIQLFMQHFPISTTTVNKELTAQVEGVV